MGRSHFLRYGELRSRMSLEWLFVVLISITFLPSLNGTLTLQPHHLSKRSQSLTVSQSTGPNFSSNGGEGGHDRTATAETSPLNKIRTRREAVVASNSSEPRSPIDTPAVTNLEDSHNQLVVYWAGLDVIICLAKDSKAGAPSTLYISNDYGSNFQNASEKLLIAVNNGTILPTLDKFFNHPKNNGHFLFTDVHNKWIFTTVDYGATFAKEQLDFVPDEVSFDPNSDRTLIAYETSTKEHRLFVSLDFGVNWRFVEESIKSVAWDESLVPTTLYLGRVEPNKLVTLLSSTSLFRDPKDTHIELTDVEEFDVKDEYIFVTKRNTTNDLKLFISYKRGDFLEALFPHELPSQHFHIADVSNGQMFVCVTHNETLTNLYIGNEPADTKEAPKFSLSLERIVFFKPNLTWTDSWLNDVTDEPFVELHRIEGLRGVYIASKFKTLAVSSRKFGLDQIQSWITFDQGGIWSPLHTPDVDDDGEPIYCKLAANYTKGNCSLHISQRVNELYPQRRAVPILSQKSAVGLVMATGTVDNSLKGHLGVFMSTDGAAHWKQVLQGNYLYNFGDHGGIIVAVKYYKLGDLTNTLLYSTDEGNSWKSFQFYKNEIRILGLMTEPGENTTVFFIFGSDTSQSKHSWVLIKVDMKKAFERQCEPSDYKEWSPWDAEPGRHCLLGRTDFYERRRPNVSCYNGASYQRPQRTKPCLCKRSDFECDFGFLAMYGDTKQRCVKDVSETSPGVKSEWCKPGREYYNRTKGYRKIPGDTCQGGESETYLPSQLPCAVGNISEFLLVAKRDSVLRFDLNDFKRMETLPLGNVRAAVAIDFDLKTNCIFWSDVNKDHIMRLHLDGESVPELLVSQDLISVEGLAFDWMSKNLYFVDGTQRTIEVIKTDVSVLGRLRKQILGPKILDKPRGIAVHPAKGFLFWTDWSNSTPYIGRSELDGSNPMRIVENADDSSATKIIKWPNGITVDVVHHLIYWVDANADVMYTADLNGKSLRKFLDNDRRISHPFAVGIYKNFVYWDDWTTRSIYATRTDIPNTRDGIITIHENLPRLMDLKVYGLHSQTGTNQCSGTNATCKHLCFATPNDTHVCQCPDGLAMRNGECLCPDGKSVVNGFCASNCNDTNAFKCRTGFCILPRWRCDGEPDCGPGDDSDELNCDAENTCAENQFRCVADGKCIPLHWQCDLDVDCDADGSDEVGCAYPNTCNSGDHFQCKNKQCISSKWRCDGEDDCGDFSDEKDCTNSTLIIPVRSCKVNEFQCADRRCISIAWVCDGDSDCLDGSDELNCKGNKCPAWKFQCATSGECIMQSWRCDGDPDCQDLSDEANCASSSDPNPPATPGTMFANCSDMDQMFECAGDESLCIPVFWVNDGVTDCPLGDDELDAVGTTSLPSFTVRPSTRTCASDHFHCDSGECIYESKVCDGIMDCSDSSDESSSCDSVIERQCPKGYVKCGLSRICIKLEKLRDGITDCPNGFDTDFGNKTIIRDECNPGQFRCEESCLPLYQLCDGTGNCMDGADERPDVCKNHKTVYQVAGISVEQLEDSRETVFIEWWLPQVLRRSMEFLPSYCEVTSKICQNATAWTTQRKYEIGSEPNMKKLKPFTNYSATVYVRTDKEIHPPAVYSEFQTLEGPSSPPFNVSISQPDVYNLCIAWNRPLYPNGKIVKYSVSFSPPTPPASVISLTENLCISNKRSNPDFIPGTNYTFWVTATNAFNTTVPSKAVSYVFHDDVAEITGVKVVAASASMVTLEWKTSAKGVTEFEVTYENQGGTYQFPTKVKSTKNQIRIEDLASGTKFRYTIVPIHNGIYGAPFKGFFSTAGKPLPKVHGVSLSISNNVITATWPPVVDERSNSWNYVVFYGKSVKDIISRRLQVKTKETKVVLKDLEACEYYMVEVGAVGPNGGGIGPMSSGKRIRTVMDERAPPKNLGIVGGENATVTVTWDAPCPFLENPIGYNVNIREINLNHTFVSTDVVYTKKPKLKHVIQLPYGGHYELTVTTNVSGARPSKPARFDGIPIPPPKMLQQCTACNAPTIYWEPPELPTPVLEKGKVTYIVWLSEDESFANATPFSTSDSSLKLDGIENEHVYYVAVSVRDSEGLESTLSEHIPLQYLQQDTSGQISMSTSNMVGIVVSVIIVISVLVAAVGFFFVRHRRLQVSFLNFASSHYSTSSGAAIFQQSVEEEMDSPVIRGFSDDEPLLVA